MPDDPNIDPTVPAIGEPLPRAVKCRVMVPVRGLGKKSGRVVDVTTVWQFDEPGGPPRLVTAYIAS